MTVGGTVSGGTPNRALFVGPGPVLADAMLDNTANAWVLVEGANTYAKVDTTNGAELVRIGSNGGPTVQIAGDPTAGEVGLQFSPSLPAVLAGGLFGVIDSTSTDTFIVNGAGDGSVEVKGTIFYIQSGTSVDVTTPSWNFASDTTFALGTNNPFSFTGSAVRMANLAADPSSPANGWIYYNTTSNKFRCYQAGAWTDCISAGGSPSIGGAITSGTQYSVLFVDPAGTIAQDNANLNFNNSTDMLTTANFTVNSGAGADLVFTESTVTRTSNIGAQTLTFNNPGTNRLDVLLADGALGLANLASDPSAPSNGFMYYDTTLSKFRCREAGVWTDCISTAPSIGGTITSGTAGSILFVDPANTFAQDNANLFWDNTNNHIGIGTATPASKLTVVAGSMPSTAKALEVTGTLATNASYGTTFQLTPTSSTQSQYGVLVQLLAGGSGGSKTFAGAVITTSSTAAGTANPLTGANPAAGFNPGFWGQSDGAGTGTNVGGWTRCLYGDICVGQWGTVGFAGETGNGFNANALAAGVVGTATVAKNTGSTTERHIGVFGAAEGGDTNVAGYFTLAGGTPTLTNGALVANNASTGSDILRAESNGTSVFRAVDEGIHMEKNVSIPAGDCDADAEVGRVRRYAKDANNITLCGCQKVGGVFGWAAVITGGDCT